MEDSDEEDDLDEEDEEDDEVRAPVRAGYSACAVVAVKHIISFCSAVDDAHSMCKTTTCYDSSLFHSVSLYVLLDGFMESPQMRSLRLTVISASAWAHSWPRSHFVQTYIHVCGCSDVVTRQASFFAIARWSVLPGKYV